MPAEPKKLRFFPLGLNLAGKKCLVVGGGVVGARKVSSLLMSGAELTVVSPVIDPELAKKVQRDEVTWIPELFQPQRLKGVFLVVVATDDAACNAQVARLANERGVLVCDTSSAERSDVIFPALLRQDDVTVAVFTDGRNPALARDTRDRIAAKLETR